MSARTARLDIRTTESAKAMIQEAADFMGMTLSAFMLSCVVEKAAKIVKQRKPDPKEIVDGHETIYLNAKESKNFWKVMKNPPEPNEKLKALFAKHKDAEKNGYYIYGKKIKNRIARKKSSSRTI